MVRIRRHGVTHSRSFSVNKYGGVIRARQAAIAYRDKKIKQWGLVKQFKGRRKHPRQRHSRITDATPIIGVTLTSAIANNGEPYYQWGATFMREGRQVHRYFGVIKYGFYEAFRLACEMRFKQCGQLIVKNAAVLPETPTVPYEHMMTLD
jgi:hypothetical protein